jgi:hypothetical protein
MRFLGDTIALCLPRLSTRDSGDGISQAKPHDKFCSLLARPDLHR